MSSIVSLSAPVDPLPPYPTAASLRMRAASMMLPPARQTVPQSAEKVRWVNNPGGGYVGPWRNADVPYTVEPAEMLTSRLYAATCFVGPAQSAKTDALILNWIAHSVVFDPADMLVVQMSQAAARDFAKRRVDRLNRDSVEVGKRLGGRRTDDNIYDKGYRGMLLSLSWPTVNELSGRPIPRVALTDYDRMPDDVDGEGSPFDLARKRTTTFGSAGMTLVESSPGKPLPAEAADWRPSTPHEAPPAPGILAIYNRGTRARWYWPCPQCNDFFEGAFRLLRWHPKAKSPAEAAESVFMECPACGRPIEPTYKAALNADGVWVHEGQRITSGGKLLGRPRKSDIASYWLKGPAAAFMTWGALVAAYLGALAEYESTGNEEPLKTTINVDQAEPYLSKRLEKVDDFGADTLKARAEAYELGQVPAAARFLLASVDVQVHSFVVQVKAYGPGLESWLIDRFEIFVSERDDGRGGRLPLDPARYIEDWDLLESKVLDKLYPLADDPTRGMAIVMMTVDSGGAPGVTERAYEFWRRQRRRGRASRVRLVKGDATRKKAPRVVESYPDSGRKDRHAGARGEVPVLLLNVDLLKDGVDADLRRASPGPGFVHLSSQLPDEVFQELTAERRTENGWERIANRRTEAFDLEVYARAAVIKLGADRPRFWDNPPAWAAPQEMNSLVRPMPAAVETKAAAGERRAPPAPTRKKSISSLLA